MISVHTAYPWRMEAKETTDRITRETFQLTLHPYSSVNSWYAGDCSRSYGEPGWVICPYHVERRRRREAFQASPIRGTPKKRLAEKVLLQRKNFFRVKKFGLAKGEERKSSAGRKWSEVEGSQDRAMNMRCDHAIRRTNSRALRSFFCWKISRILNASPRSRWTTNFSSAEAEG